MRRMILPAVVAALVLPAPAYPQLAPSQGGRAALAAFNRFDRDRDRGLTVAELQARGRERGADTLFKLLDADGDGRLSLRELGVPNGSVYGRFDAYDVNKDGFVTRREFPNFVDPLLFLALDRNRDGRLSLSELRPSFAGGRADPLPVTAPPPARAKAKPPAPSWCWITGFGGHDWTIEAPVAWGPCRTH